MYDEKYVPTEEDMKRYEDITSRKAFSEYTYEDRLFVARVFQYLNLKKIPSVEQIDREIEENTIRVDGVFVDGRSPFDLYCERVGYYDRHPDKRPGKF